MAILNISAKISRYFPFFFASDRFSFENSSSMKRLAPYLKSWLFWVIFTSASFTGFPLSSTSFRKAYPFRFASIPSRILPFMKSFFSLNGLKTFLREDIVFSCVYRVYLILTARNPLAESVRRPFSGVAASLWSRTIPSSARQNSGQSAFTSLLPKLTAQKIFSPPGEVRT